MTYSAAPSATLLVDILRFNSQTTVSVGTEFTLNDTIRNTTATIDSSGYIVLHNSSSWRLECNAMCQFAVVNTTYYAEWYWYDGSSNLGNKGFVGNIGVAEIGRHSCTLLLPSSSITGTITLRPRISAVTGSPGYDGVYTVPPSMRVYELPN